MRLICGVGASVVAVGLALLVGPAARAAEQAESGWRRCTSCLGRADVAGAREALEERGIELAIGITAVWQANHRGGVRSHPEGKLTTSWDLSAALDTETLGLWPGGTAFVYLEGTKGSGIEARPYVGSLFGVNADASGRSDHHAQFSEYWYQHTFGEGLLAVKVGKIDSTVDFDINAFANDECTQFLNGALVNNPSVPFPDYALGAQAIVRPGGGLYAAVGAFDANADGATSGRDTALVADSDWFVVAEAGIELAIPAGGDASLPGSYRVGAWHDPTRYLDPATEESRKGESGWYASVDQMVFRESADNESSQGLGLFARYGYAPDDYSGVEHFWSVGAQYQGLIPTRDDDVLGIGLAQGKLGRRTRRTTRYDNETVVECFYNIAVAGGAALTLDLQYVRHPGAALASSLVPGLRFQLDF